MAYDAISSGSFTAPDTQRALRQSTDLELELIAAEVVFRPAPGDHRSEIT